MHNHHLIRANLSIFYLYFSNNMDFIYFLLLLSAIFIVYAALRKTHEPFAAIPPWATHLDDNGVITLPNVFSENDTKPLKALVYNQVESKSLRLGAINNRSRRLDMIVPLNALTKSILAKAWRSIKDGISKYDQNPYVIECSSFVNMPYSDPQTWHSDVLPEDMPPGTKLFSIAILLEDTDESMGPLEVIPKSHIREIHAHQRECNPKLEHICGYFHDDVKYTSCVGSLGSMIVWDATVQHRSGANRSGKVRSMFYFSILCGTSVIPNGITHSIEKRYRNKPLRINQFL